MARTVTTPYHLGPQSAFALLPPVTTSLGELEARLTQYVERIPMPDADREALERALGIVAECRRRVAEISVGADRARG